MEGELWNGVYNDLVEVGKKIRLPHKQFSDWWIAAVFMWAVLHDRPILWACQTKNWPADKRWWRLPSPATMSRRMRNDSFNQLLMQVEQSLRKRCSISWCKWIDALPLPIGGATQDPDARYGRSARTMAKGYKLYAICDPQAGFDVWKIQPMNVNEKRVAVELISKVDTQGYLVGDGEYDSSSLYDVAAQRGIQLVAPKKTGQALGHRPCSPNRLRSIELQTHPFGQYLLHCRAGIDRFFGQWGNFGAGLKPLPHWVRRLWRVQLWIQGKIILNCVRLAQKQ
jgi:hypothetical protein